jgi:hypothetical protein
MYILQTQATRTHTHTHTPHIQDTQTSNMAQHARNDHNSCGDISNAHNDAETEKQPQCNKPTPETRCGIDIKLDVTTSGEGKFSRQTAQPEQPQCGKPAPETTCGVDIKLDVTSAAEGSRQTAEPEQPQRGDSEVDEGFWSSCVVSDALRDFEEDMQERGYAKVYASRRALYMLHSTQVNFVRVHVCEYVCICMCVFIWCVKGL